MSTKPQKSSTRLKKLLIALFCGTDSLPRPWFTVHQETSSTLNNKIRTHSSSHRAGVHIPSVPYYMSTKPRQATTRPDKALIWLSCGTDSLPRPWFSHGASGNLTKQLALNNKIHIRSSSHRADTQLPSVPFYISTKPRQATT